MVAGAKFCRQQAFRRKSPKRDFAAKAFFLSSICPGIFKNLCAHHKSVMKGFSRRYWLALIWIVFLMIAAALIFAG